MLSNQTKLHSIGSCYTSTQLYLRGIYLEYANDYIGYVLMAEHRGISEATMRAMVEEGRAIHEDIVAVYKLCANE